MSGDHDHDHDHAHDHAPASFGRAFAIGIALQSTFIVAEIIVGLSAHSLAVLSDAGHNVSDVLALVLAWAATRLGRRKATKGRTYGWKSASILAAVFNSVTLVFVNGAVAWEAIGRFSRPEPVAALPVIVVSVVGVAVNGFCAWLFAKGSKEDVNVRAAFLHLASDAGVAAGVAVTGALIYWTHLVWLDAAASLVVSAIVLASTWSLLRRALNLALHAVPEGIDEAAIERWLAAVPGVVSVHDLHVWAMSTTENALTAHLVMAKLPAGALACELDTMLRATFKVHHVALQLDPEGAVCALAEAHAS
jgi:cobalt-zinc-cadmium efflux system protein